MFDSDARDQGIFHFSPGSVSLVVGGRQYHPVATLESAAIAVAARPDDYLLTPAGADLVFVLDRDVAFEGDTLADDAYLQVKRYTRIDLGDMPIASRIAFSDQTHLLRKVPIRRNIGQVAGNVTQINQSEAAFEAPRRWWPIST